MNESPPKPVALVSMPTLSARFPSFQLGLLKPVLEQQGIGCQTFSLFMYFGQYAGFKLTEGLAEVWPSLVGEWLWARAAFGEFASDVEYFDAYRENLTEVCAAAGCTLQDLLHVRNHVVEQYLDDMLDAADWSRFGMVGFTVVFQQMLASLAFARRLRARFPDLPIVFGGATFEDDIAEEVIRNCPQVDFVHCGDAEDTFPELVRRVAAGKSVAGIGGVMSRSGTSISYAGRAPNLADMNRTPTPDFDEYFHARTESGYETWPHAQNVLLPFETARGCWWGMKNHCTFCGLNRSGMDFRAKSVDGVLQMLSELSMRYGVTHLNAIDNIMAPEYVEDLFGRLADSRSDIRLHYEIRPNVKHKVLRRMRDGGLFSVQPGVESLSTRLLRLMKKHTTAMRNVELLKWCTYYGINNLYNILVRFAGESQEDYLEQVAVVRRILHFQPPYGMARARPDRGSPMYTDPELHGISGMRPEDCYRFLYPSPPFNLRRVSYYFQPQTHGMLPDEGYQPLFDAVGQWQRLWENGRRPYLRHAKLWNHLVIEDGRNPAQPKQVVLSGADAELFERCEDATDANALGDSDAVRLCLQRLQEQDLVLQLDGKCLALSLPMNTQH